MKKYNEMKIYHKYILYKNKLLKPYVSKFLGVLSIFTYIAAVVFLISLIVEHGFMVSLSDILIIHTLRKLVWVLFFWYFFLNIVLQFNKCRAEFKTTTWILVGMFVLTFIPFFFREPEESGVYLWLWQFFDGHFYQNLLLFLLSITTLSNGLVRLIGHHTNLSLTLAVSFFCIIVIGTGLLKLPRCSVHGISWIDSLFISTSAVCVTGLTPIDIATEFTTVGQIVLITLIQIGGLGVMTLTSFFAMFFMRNTSLYNQLAMRDMTSSESLNSLLTTLLYILTFTLSIEIIGMLAIWFDIHGSLGMSLKQELGFSAFHSISAFCNAGFSNMQGSLGCKTIMSGHNFLFVALSILVIFGGLGFPVMINIKDWVTNYYQRIVHHRYFKHRMVNINTRIVLITTLSLLLFGTLSLLILEWDHAFAGLPVVDKVTQAFFNATVPRTAGFTSINLMNFSIQSLLIYAFLMWIGGASQSTAGGVKVNVFAVAMINLFAVLRRTERVEIFDREISRDTVRHSDATVVLSILTIGIFVFFLSLTDGDIPIFKLFFECISAMGTVGSSLNVTPHLSQSGKILISLLMFIGRVGFITLLMGLIGQKKYTKYRYPSDNIFIN